MTKHDHEQSPDESILGYKVEQLRSDFSSLKEDINDIKGTVTRIEQKFSDLPCHVHEIKQEVLEKRMDKMEGDTEKAKTYINRLAGALVVITVIIQLVGPVILGYVFPNSHADPATIGKKQAQHSSVTYPNIPNEKVLAVAPNTNDLSYTKIVKTAGK